MTSPASLASKCLKKVNYHRLFVALWTKWHFDFDIQQFLFTSLKLDCPIPLVKMIIDRHWFNARQRWRWKKYLYGGLHKRKRFGTALYLKENNEPQSWRQDWEFSSSLCTGKQRYKDRNFHYLPKISSTTLSIRETDAPKIVFTMPSRAWCENC